MLNRRATVIGEGGPPKNKPTLNQSSGLNTKLDFEGNCGDCAFLNKLG
jgi:hypothetical protein